MDLSAFEFRDPGAVVEQVAEDVGLEEDSVYVVLVDRPSTEQRIVAVRRLATPALIDEYEEARDELHDVMQQLPIPGGRQKIRHAVTTIVVRPGLCVFGPNEGCWFAAWRYSNHFASAFTGDVILVTEHGWCDFMTQLAGHSPALTA